MTDGDNDKIKSDCEVCKQLIREKHKYGYIWKIACLLFALIAVVFIILYFASGKNEVTSEIDLSGANIDTGGDDNTIVIGGENAEISGTVTTTDNTPLICITVILSVVVLVIGGIIIVVSQKNKT